MLPKAPSIFGISLILCRFSCLASTGQSETTFDWPIGTRYENQTESWYIFHPYGFAGSPFSGSGTHLLDLFSFFSPSLSVLSLFFDGFILPLRPCWLDSRRAVPDGGFKFGVCPNFNAEVRAMYDCLYQGSTDMLQIYRRFGDVSVEPGRSW